MHTFLPLALLEAVGDLLGQRPAIGCCLDFQPHLERLGDTQLDLRFGFTHFVLQRTIIGPHGKYGPIMVRRQAPFWSVSSGLMKPTDPQFKLRLPPALKGDLEKRADREGKTLTAIIVGRLEEADRLAEEAARIHEVAEGRQHALDVVMGAYELLAGMVVTLIERLPAKQQQEEGAKLVHRLARSIVTRDGAEMADSYADLFAGLDEEVVREMRKVRNELVHSHPKKR